MDIQSNLVGGIRRRARRIVRTGAPALAAALAIGAAASRGAAQSPSTAAALTLGDVYRAVLRDNPRPQAAQAMARAAEARVAPAARPPDPQLQLGFMNYALPALTPMRYTGMTQLSLMQMVPVPGTLALGARAAQAGADGAEARAEDVAWMVRREAASAFYELYRTDRSLAIARETLLLLQDVLHTAEAMYRVGDGRQADVLRAQVELARMGEDTLRLTAEREAAAARLNALLDRGAGTAVGAPRLPAFPASVPDRDSLTAMAQASRPLIRALREGVAQADATARLARKSIWPDVAVGVQYGWRDGDMGTERMGSLMLGASLPVFARSRQLRARDEAAAMQRAAEAEVAAASAETRGAVGVAHAALMRARRLALLYRSTVLPQADATVASAMSAYRVGAVDFMTLLDDRLAVNRYRRELAALEADEGMAWAELETLTARPLVDADAPTATTMTGGAR